MRALVTGSRGFAGSALVSALNAAGYTTLGFDLRDNRDVRDYEQVRTAVEEFEPDEVYHLAAAAWPGESLANPRRVVDISTTGALNVLEACRTTGSQARILLAGSSEEYGYEGLQPGAVLDESSPCAPTTPYGAGKLAAAALGQAYGRRYGMHTVMTRAFNHTGWGKPVYAAESSWARQIVAVERGEASYVTHGDLSAVRDFSDVNDVVRAYQQVASCAPGVYNICSGQPVEMRRIMSVLLEVAGMDNAVLKENALLGRADRGQFPVTSHSKLTRACGWLPRVPLEESLRNVIEYWRSR